MRKDEFMSKLARESGLYKYQAQMFWNAFIKVLIDELNQNGKVNIKKFGSFKLKKVAPYEGGNPLEKDKTLQIPEHTRIYFKPGEVLKRAINKDTIGYEDE